MKVKRYVVREMQEAIRLIKQDLGPEAVIVSSYKVPARGLAGLFSPRLLEVTAALDENSGAKQAALAPVVRLPEGAGNGDWTDRTGPAGRPAGEFPVGVLPPGALPAAGGRGAFSPVRTLCLTGGEPGGGPRGAEAPRREPESGMTAGGSDMAELRPRVPEEGAPAGAQGRVEPPPGGPEEMTTPAVPGLAEPRGRGPGEGTPAGVPGRAELPPRGQEEEKPTGRPARNSNAGPPANRPGTGGESLFETIYKGRVEAELNGDPLLRWRKILLEQEVREDIVDQLLSALPDGRDSSGEGRRELYISLLNQVARLLEPAYRSGGRARTLIFTGPAGVGKTTTLAKLATRFALDGRKKIALVAVYTYRIGAVEQLRAYGDFLGVPVEVVMTPAELAGVLGNHADKDYILIDTAGRSARHAAQVLELKGFLDVVAEPRDVFLVLSAAVKDRDLLKTAREFRRIGYTRLIFTRLDETETYGSILNLVCALGTPVAYLAGGQAVPDDINEAGPAKIAKLLLGGVEPDEVVVS